MITIRAFFPKIRELFSNVWKRTEENSPPLPPLPSSYVPASCYWKHLSHFCLSKTWELVFNANSELWQTFFLYYGYFHRHWRFTGQQGKGGWGTFFYSTLPLPPAHKHWDICLELCMWDDYHVFLIATLVFTRLLLDEIYHLTKLPFDWLIDDAKFVCLLDELILGFCYSNLTWETGGLSSHRLSTLYYKRTD